MATKLMKMLGGSFLAAMLLAGCANDTQDPPPEEDTEIEDPAKDDGTIQDSIKDDDMN
ncbi:hypothetical protein [Bacillus sp. T33-2]|uniref:hypothetical protein n=1 Tax=Bacillus sp. T33-2 TaxID=2054168 RepID=UPI0015E0FBD4|nr:hypothetical protein [Bacillus sp. T33-2]